MIPPELRGVLNGEIDPKKETPDVLTQEFFNFVAPKGRERLSWLGKIKSAVIPNWEDFSSPNFKWKNALFFSVTAFVLSGVTSGYVLRVGTIPINELVPEILFKGAFSLAAGILTELLISNLNASKTTPLDKK